MKPDEQDMKFLLFPLIAVLISLSGATFAADNEVALIIKDHRFEPAVIKVAAGQKIKLLVHNQDASAEEFESHELGREKIIPGGAKAIIFIGPLRPGRYPFYGEFNDKTAQGVVIAE